MRVSVGIIALVLALSSSIFAHEGHDKSPGAVAAPHGGQIQGTGDLYVEVLQNNGAVEIFLFSHDLKPISPSEAKVSGLVTLPKKTKGETITFKSVSDRYTTKIDSKGSHRFELALTISYKGKSEKTKFNIEPQ